MKDRKLILVIILLITLAFTSCSSSKYTTRKHIPKKTKKYIVKKYTNRSDDGAGASR